MRIYLTVCMMIEGRVGDMDAREQDYEKLGELVRRLQADKKDEEAFEALYSNVLPHLMFTARMLSGNKEQDALDLVQQTLLQFYAKVDTISQPRTVLKWLGITMRRIKSDQVRKLSNANEILTDDAGDSLFGALRETARGALPEEQADAEETRRLVREMIATLPEEQQQTIIYRYVEELSISEIAELMDRPVPTVKSRLRYAEKSVKEQTLALERKGTKLYAVSLPLLYLVLRDLLHVQGAVSAKVAESLLTGLRAGIGFTAGATSTTAAASATQSGAGIAVGSATATKVIAGVAIAALLVGGGIAAIRGVTPAPSVKTPLGESVEQSNAPSQPTTQLDLADYVGRWSVDSWNGQDGRYAGFDIYSEDGEYRVGFNASVQNGNRLNTFLDSANEANPVLHRDNAGDARALFTDADGGEGILILEFENEIVRISTDYTKQASAIRFPVNLHKETCTQVEGDGSSVTEIQDAQLYAVGPYTFTLDISKDFLDQVYLRSGDNFLAIEDKISADAGWGGSLFTISYWEDKAYQDGPNHRVLYDGAQGDLIAIFPSDLQFSAESKDTYYFLRDQGDGILDTLSIIH